MVRPDAARSTAWIALLFFLSGLSSLVYQIVWVRMLLPVFGTSVEAVATVVTAFMAGLALGAARFSRLADRRENGLGLYAALEAGIGLAALAFPLLLFGLDDLYTLLYRQAGSGSFAFAAARFGLSCTVLIVPTFLMGGTLPVLVGQLARLGGGTGRSAGLLYAVNTAGAALGSILAGFWLLERLGVRGTTFVAAGANLLVAALAWVLSRRLVGIPSPYRADLPGAASEPAVFPPISRALVRVVFWGYALSGATALACQVIWTRVLSVVLALTTTQSLSVIVVLFLIGIAGGSAVGAAWADRLRRLATSFGVLEVLLGGLYLLSLVSLGFAPRIAEALASLPSFSGHVVRITGTAAIVILPPTFLMGLLFPIAGKLYATGGRPGARIGGIYAINTAGSIVGAFCGGFVLIPLLGSRTSLLLLALCNIVVGSAALVATREVRATVRAAVVCAGLAAVALTRIALPNDHLARSLAQSREGRLLYHAEGTAGTVTVFETPAGERLLRVNGAGEVPTDWSSLRVFRLLGTLPMALHPEPRDVLVIAFGGGITLAAVELQAPERVDCVEVVPEVVEAGGLLERYNRGVHRRVFAPPFELIADDGRNHVLRTERTYDVLISDSTHPSTADSWVLYTREFYEQCRARRKPGGIVAQWLPLHGLTVDDYRMILRTFRSVFPQATLWWSPGYSVLLATDGPLRIDYSRLAARIERPGARDDLAEVGLDEPAWFIDALALDAAALEAWAGPGPVNTDDRPRIGLHDRTRVGTASGLPVALALLPHRIERPDLVVDGASAEQRRRLRLLAAARHPSALGALAARLGDLDRARRELSEALALAPDDPVARRAMAQLSLLEAGQGN